MKKKIICGVFLLLFCCLTLTGCFFRLINALEEQAQGYTLYCYDEEEGEPTEVKVESKTDNTVTCPYRRYYAFLGYYTAEGIQVFDAEGAQVEEFLIDRDVTVYAKFEAIPYTVRFDPDGGTFSEGVLDTAPICVDAWTLTPPIPTPADESLEFLGWYSQYGDCYTDEEGQVNYEQFSPTRNVYADHETREIVLFAKYRKKAFEVILDYNNGTMKTVVLTVEHGTVLDFTPYWEDDTVGGYEIIGWSTSPYEYIEYTAPVTGRLRLYASWQRYKNVRFVYGANDVRTVKIIDAGGSLAALPDATRLAHDFDGWYSNESCSGNPLTHVSFDALAHTYYAKFVPIDYTITFHTGCEQACAPLTYRYGYSDRLPVLTRDGFEHVGWSEKSDGTGRVFFYLPSGTMGNMDLYAVWQSI